MRSKLFVCGLLAASTSLPAFAGERKAAPVLPDAVPSTGKAAPRVAGRPAPFLLPLRSAPATRGAQALLRLQPGEGSVPRDDRVAAGPSLDTAGGARRAVRDALDAHPKPRQPRSPLSTALVLRIDGDRDSPPLSVGGGGVAGVMWRLLPR